MENVNKAEEIKNYMDSSLEAKANELSEKSAEAVETVKSEFDGKLNEKAEQIEMLQKQIDDMKETQSKNWEVKNRKESDFTSKFNDLSEKISNTKATGSKTVLELKDFGSGFTGAFNGDIYLDERVSDIKYVPNHANRLRNYITTGSTSGTGSIRFNQENFAATQRDRSGGKAKGASANQQNYEINSLHAPIETVMNLVTIPEEWLDDVAMVESYLSKRLMGDLMDVEDDYILNGSGTSNQFTGINVGAAAANQLTTGTLADAFFGPAFQDQIADANRFDVLTAVAGELMQLNYNPNLAILAPVDYYAMTLIKGTDGQYALTNTVAPDGSYKTFWNGIEVIKSTAQAAGTFTVLDTSVTQYWTREGVSIEFDRNENDFATNSVSVRAKLRGAMTHYLPGGIVTGTFAAATGSLETP